MVTAPVAASLGCPAWMASVSKRYMFPLLPHELRRTLTLLTCRGEKLQEGPGSRRQSVYASAPGRGINIRRVMRRDMAAQDIETTCTSSIRHVLHRTGVFFPLLHPTTSRRHDGPGSDE